MTNQIEKLESELHEIENQMESLRRRIWAVENGLELVDDPEAELAQMRTEFDDAGKRFTTTYSAWRRQHAAE